jgi:hypothetical protein
LAFAEDFFMARPFIAFIAFIAFAFVWQGFVAFIEFVMSRAFIAFIDFIESGMSDSSVFPSSASASGSHSQQ